MQTYSVNNKERVKVIVLLVILSYFIAILINKVLERIMNIICNIEWIDSFISQIEFTGMDIKQITLLAIFWVLYEWFDKDLWKMKIFQKTCVNIPNLNGQWKGTYYSDYNGKKEGLANLEIKQTWTKISIISHHLESDSFSRVANILLDTNKGTNIVFQYENITNEKSSDTMHDHKGYSDLIYTMNQDKEILKGEYTGDQINRKAAGYVTYEKIK